MLFVSHNLTSDLRHCRSMLFTSKRVRKSEDMLKMVKAYSV